MFEQLFQHHPRALARQQSGPLAEERRRYLVHCAKQQMSRETLHGLANYLLIIAESLRLGVRSSELISPEEIDAAVLQWVNRPRPINGKKLQIAFRNRAIGWLT